MNSASTNLVKQLIGPENRLNFHRYILNQSYNQSIFILLR